VSGRSFRDIAGGALRNWVRADGFGLSAALSFYTIFSLAPILGVAMVVASRVLTAAQAAAGAKRWLGGFLPQAEADSVVDTISAISWQSEGNWTHYVAGAVFVWAASMVFVRLRVSVIRLLGQRSASWRHAVAHTLVGRLVALSVTVGAGLVVVVGIVATISASNLTLVLSASYVPLAEHLGTSVLVVGAVILMLRILPLERVGWHATLLSGLFVLAAFECGRLVIGFVLSHSLVVSAYGAASTLVVVLLWFYYQAQIVLFGVSIAREIEMSRAAVVRLPGASDLGDA
jgi:membrane protein